MGKKNNVSIKNKNIDKITNQVGVAKNCNIGENIYNYNIIQYVVNDSESRSNDGFRNLLRSIFKNTEEDSHIFSGFINNINYRDKQIYLVNVYWNKRVYATNHVVLFPKDVTKFEIGDFIVFKGIIDKYTRGKNKNKTKDIGINDIELIKNISFPELNIETYDREFVNFDYLKSRSQEELIHIFNIQMNRIRIKLEKFIDISPNVYESILFNIFYENTMEQDMITTRLNILEGNKDILQLTEWIMYIRYLVCEVNMISPYMIYNMMLIILNNTNKIRTEAFQYYIAIAKRSNFISNLKYDIINNSFSHYLNKYIEEINTILF